MSKKTKRKHSITSRLALTILSLVAGTILLCWTLNVTLLEGYYEKHKQNVLVNGYVQIDKASMDGTLTTKDFDVPFEKICANGNMTMLILTAEGEVVRSSTNGTDALRLQFWDMMMESAGDEEALNMSVIESNGRYTLGEKADERLDADYLVLWGVLSDGNVMLARTPLQSIRESAEVSNHLLSYVGVLALIGSAVVIYFVTRRITNPILQLTDISKRMAALDFNVKYEGQGDSEIEQLGEYMNQLSGTLEQTISELKSANNELQQDIEKKEQIDEMRKEFLSNVSHELKTPLALIQGYAEGLKECVQEDDESRDFYCEVIMDEADKMNQMVKKLLTLNQLEFGNDVVVMEHFDITELIRGVVNSSSILLEQNNITVTFEEPPVFVWADEFKTEEVVTNFLSNAIHYAENEKRIAIRYTMQEDSVRIGVFNSGMPIQEEDIDNIWIKFYKADKARTREYGGSGIGLSIVKAIMDAMHQQCGVINYDNGVEFWFELDRKNK